MDKIPIKVCTSKRIGLEIGKSSLPYNQSSFVELILTGLYFSKSDSWGRAASLSVQTQLI